MNQGMGVEAEFHWMQDLLRDAAVWIWEALIGEAEAQGVDLLEMGANADAQADQAALAAHLQDIADLDSQVEAAGMAFLADK